MTTGGSARRSSHTIVRKYGSRRRSLEWGVRPCSKSSSSRRTRALMSGCSANSFHAPTATDRIACSDRTKCARHIAGDGRVARTPVGGQRNECSERPGLSGERPFQPRRIIPSNAARTLPIAPQRRRGARRADEISSARATLFGRRPVASSGSSATDARTLRRDRPARPAPSRHESLGKDRRRIHVRVQRSGDSAIGALAGGSIGLGGAQHEAVREEPLRASVGARRKECIVVIGKRSPRQPRES